MFQRALPPCLASLLLLGSCVPSESPTRVDREVAVPLLISPALIPSPANSGALPINRIRARASRVEDGGVLGEAVIDVDPAATEWQLDLRVMATSDPVDARVFLSLLNVSGASESVEFSGMTDPIRVVAGETTVPADIDVVRGPLDNLFVTSVSIAGHPDTLYEGAAASVDAVAGATGDAEPRVYLTALDSAVLSASDSTVVALLPGSGRLAASAGAHADTVTIVVRPAPAGIIVSPDSVSVPRPGDSVAFSAVVVDARGDTLSSETVSWRTPTPGVLASLGNGVFEAVASGGGVVEAASDADPTVVGRAAMTVGASLAPGVDVAVLKSVDDAQPLPGDTVTFTVSVTNNGPGAVTGIAVYDSLPAIFGSPAHTVSAGALSGDTLWTLPGLATGATATWATTVTVSPNAAGSTATNTALLRSVAERDTTAANDTAAVTVSVAVSDPPSVSIQQPADSSVFDPGELVTFTASALDPEDGDLSPSIQWASSLDGTLGTGRSISTDQLSTGVHTVTATATDSDGGTGTDSITITVALYTIPATLNVPFGGTASLPISLTEPAPTGGVTLTVVSDDASVTRPQSSTVFIPEGVQSANATLDGLAPGTANVSVSSAQFGVVTSVVSVTAQLNILSTTARFPSTFTQDITIRLESAGNPLAAPAGGLTVLFTSRNPGCVAAPAPVTIPQGLVSTSATLQFGGNATTPCSTNLVSTAPNTQPDSVDVTIDPAPSINMQDRTVGSGLQEYTSLSLGAALPAGDTLTLTSSNPAVLLAPDATTQGTNTLKLTGQTTVHYFYIQAVEGFTGQVTLTASAPGFAIGRSTATVVQPGVRIESVPAATTTLSGNDAIWARTGPESGNGSLLDIQEIRAGGPTLTVTFISTNGAVATLVTQSETNDTVTAQITAGQSLTPTSLANGGVELDPLTADSSFVYAEAPGFVSVDTATVRVSAPSINMQDRTVGSGLQEYTSLSLGAALPAGDTLTLTSSNPAVLLAPDATTQGTNTLKLTGQTTVHYFYIQAVEGFTGQVTLTASAPGFTDGVSTATVVSAGIRLNSLNNSYSASAADDAFWADVGAVVNGSIIDLQEIRAGGPTLTVTFVSSNGSAATLATSAGTGDSRTAQIIAGEYRTPTSVAAGGVAIDPIAAGSTVVSVSAPGYVSATGSSQSVTINP